VYGKRVSFRGADGEISVLRGFKVLNPNLSRLLFGNPAHWGITSRVIVKRELL